MQLDFQIYILDIPACERNNHLRAMNISCACSRYYDLIFKVMSKKNLGTKTSYNYKERSHVAV